MLCTFPQMFLRVISVVIICTETANAQVIVLSECGHFFIVPTRIHFPEYHFVIFSDLTVSDVLCVLIGGL